MENCIRPFFRVRDMKNPAIFKLRALFPLLYHMDEAAKKEALAMKDTFSINDLAMITGLSTRTIRNYLAAGVLSGEKRDGAWRFSPEQVEAFTQNPAIRPSIKARKHAIVFDFMGTKPYGRDKMCAVLDLADREPLGASVFFCKMISDCKPEAELHFAADPLGAGVRLILSGSPADVMLLMNRFFEEQGTPSA